MKKLLLLFIMLLTLGCEPKGPYKSQDWWDNEDTTIISEYDQSIIDMLDTATTMDTIFPEYDPELECTE